MLYNVLFFFCFHIGQVMCQGHNKVWGRHIGMIFLWTTKGSNVFNPMLRKGDFV